MAMDYQQAARDLAALENNCLLNVYHESGAEACEAAARHLLQATAAIYGFVAGPEKLREIFTLIEAAQNTGLLS